ncbi:MBOAT family protein [Enterobacter soli]|uniref:MBOAT family protein n=1 Tax=Enterobacter soli TaxID=885040 RepID=UPI0034CE57CE
MAVLFTIEFLFGFWMFFILYWLVAPLPKVQNGLLLLGGYYFVYHISAYSLLILLSWSLCVWLLVKLAQKRKCGSAATALLVLLMLGYFIAFKYWMPLADWLRGVLESLNASWPLPVVEILLPLGLSFYLFNSLSLVRSVAKREIAPPDLLSVLLYVSFIPTLVAGPVNRAVDLMPQIRAARRHVLDLKTAFCLIALALIKLFLLSTWLCDTLVNPVFNQPAEHSGWETVIGVYGWAWNIYLNFSGYTNLVTGLGMLLGYRLPKNFAHPYAAASLQAFWHRWHISLSNFIRDYIYFPLGGSRKGMSRTQINVLLAMVISGLWHGAGVNFMLWGAIHGVGLIIYNLWRAWRPRPLPETLARLLTFHYVCLAWIFFRAESVEDAWVLLHNIQSCSLLTLTSAQMWSIAAFILLVVFYPRLVNLRLRAVEMVSVIRWYAIPFIIVPVLTFAFFFAPSGVPGFIYANF